MATYTFKPVPAWGAVGQFARVGLAKSKTFPVTLPAGGSATVVQGGATKVGYVDSDSTGLVPQFTTTDIPSVMIDFGFGPLIIHSLEAISAGAASAAAAAGSASAASSSASAASASAAAAAATLSGKVSKGDLVFNVKDYGAVGNGTTDDLAAFNSAVAAIPASGGILFVPAGMDCRLSAGVRLKSNVTVEMTGATLRKTSTQTDYYVFTAGVSGTGVETSNVTIRGGTIRGSFTSGSVSGASLTFNRVRGLHIENVTFTEAIVSGHAIDLGGCSGVRVRDCMFEGWSPQSTKEYVEAIQLDFSTRLGNAVDAGVSGAYTGEGTRDVVVEGCRFVPLTIGATTYPAPNPLGSHSRVEARWIEKVTFTDNYVEGGRRSDDITDPFALFTRGWVHFTHIRGLRIADNVFVNTGSASVRVIACPPYGTGTLLADVALTSPTSQTINPLTAQDVVISGNTFRGFNSAVTSEDLVMIQGHSTAPTYARSIVIENNHLDDCAAVTTDASNTGSRFVYADYVNGLTVSRNRVEATRTLVEAQFCQTITVDGNLCKGSSWDALRLYNSTDVTVTRNQLLRHNGGTHMISNVGVVIADNRYTAMGGATNAARESHLALSGLTTFLVHHNNLSGTITQASTKGIYAYSGSTRGRIESNVVLGATTPVVITGLTNVTETGTVST